MSEIQQFRTDPKNIVGNKYKADSAEFGEDVAFSDHKISFVVRHCRDKDVLDLGCVQHDPEARRSRYWSHRALKQTARTLLGLDLSQEGVEQLRGAGFNVVWADAQNFDLDASFDVINAGDLIEHLEDFAGFFESCKRHLRPGGCLLISTPNPWFWKNVVLSALFTKVPVNPEHTCWMCPGTLRQLAARHGFIVEHVEYGSRRLKERIVPLPRGIKHASWHARLVVAPS